MLAPSTRDSKKSPGRRYRYPAHTTQRQNDMVHSAVCGKMTGTPGPELTGYTATPHRAKTRIFPPSHLLLSSLKSVHFSHILIYTLFLSSANPVISRRCDIDKCGAHYRSISPTDDAEKRCRLLSLHGNCLMKLNAACRGNLLYHTSVHINENKLLEWNCSQASTNAIDSVNRAAPRTNQCLYAGKPVFKFCGLFGDPHVRTFSDKLHTCSANGSWKLVDNAYLTVRAINSQLPGQLRATAVTKLVVYVRRSGECAKKKRYRADIREPLPATFEDGSSHTGTNESVNITVQDSGREVRIDVRFIATTIVIRHVGSHLTFSIQMPEEMIDSSRRRNEQMCVRGCPRRQRIPLTQEIKRLTSGPGESAAKKYTEPEARRKCRDVLLNSSQEIAPVRAKRGAGKNARRNRQKKDAELSASAKSWGLLHPDSTGGAARAGVYARETHTRPTAQAQLEKERV